MSPCASRPGSSVSCVVSSGAGRRCCCCSCCLARWIYCRSRSNLVKGASGWCRVCAGMCRGRPGCGTRLRKVYNILFNLPPDKARYQKTLAVCVCSGE
ncbi:hypothetical protein FIBSPDRAFT_399296 [Athelia psychrophila]|uniref:Uncharacterized protein n=1 Tax=Athelia psychrophila TaxID=1759441 RepID=A0A166NEQ0_9AGAM|nr:hypothetical protein FIBSPDRAFT_399296 [Fibularhizoctonia sp. CBS 109695]